MSPWSPMLARTRAAVGVFGSVAAVKGAVDAMRQKGFQEAGFTLLTAARTLERHLGAIYEAVPPRSSPMHPLDILYRRRVAGGNDDDFPFATFVPLGSTPGAGLAVVSSGRIATILMAIVAPQVEEGDAAGILARVIDSPHAQSLVSDIDEDSLLLWAETGDQAQEQQAARILLTHSGHRVRIHDIFVPASPGRLAC